MVARVGGRGREGDTGRYERHAMLACDDQAHERVPWFNEFSMGENLKVWMKAGKALAVFMGWTSDTSWQGHSPPFDVFTETTTICMDRRRVRFFCLSSLSHIEDAVQWTEIGQLSLAEHGNTGLRS